MLDSENSEVWVVLPQFAHNSYLCVKFWVKTCGNEQSPVLVAVGWLGWLISRRERS